VRERVDVLRAAANARRVVAFDYAREDGTPSVRSARPLGLFFWGRVWTLGAWCELRDDFRTFRVDRMAGVRPLDRTFVEESGRSLADLFARYGVE
jgi:predicted DNA-binding transcriptional regulator YafY